MWADVRRLALVLLATMAAGCGLVLDTSPPDTVPDAGPACTVDDDCNREACGGFENCVAGQCVTVIAPLVCDDDIPCTANECADGGCRFVPDDDACDSGKVCIPQEGGCVTPKACDVPADCDDGNVCTAAQDCVDNVCVIPAGQTDLVCPAFDGCGVIGCDPSLGCVVTGTDFSLCAAFEDKVACTLTECDPNGTCLDVPSAAVCESLGAPNCFVPLCEPENDFAHADSGCVFRPNDEFCASSDPTSGCATSLCGGLDVGGADSDGCIHQVVADVCSDAVCDLESGLCTAVAPVDCADDSECDDGDPCNGLETCDVGNGVCQAGQPPCQQSTGTCERVLCDPELFEAGNLDAVCVTLPGTDCFSIGAP